MRKLASTGKPIFQIFPPKSKFCNKSCRIKNVMSRRRFWDPWGFWGTLALVWFGLLQSEMGKVWWVCFEVLIAWETQKRRESLKCWFANGIQLSHGWKFINIPCMLRLFEWSWYQSSTYQRDIENPASFNAVGKVYMRTAIGFTWHEKLRLKGSSTPGQWPGFKIAFNATRLESLRFLSVIKSQIFWKIPTATWAATVF